MIEYSESNGAIFFGVRVVPRASKSQVTGEYDGSLKIHITSAPVDGAANGELVRVLAKYFDVSKGNVVIVSGETSKHKRIKIENLSTSDFEEKIR